MSSNDADPGNCRPMSRGAIVDKEQNNESDEVPNQADLLMAITGKIERVPTSISYRIAALAVACLMILLPMIYVGLIILAIGGVCWYAVNGIAFLQTDPPRNGAGGFGLLLLYVGPLVIGISTVLFMIKPLFGRPERSDRLRSLTRDGEPKLFAFVDKLCESVHAPTPKRIDVDCSVNASASFRNGMFSLFVPSDLVLTIGMPLVAGLTARQLGGVLAHEFGHFSQGFGMRVSYVVRTNGHWFARVVYERDSWDGWLDSLARSLDLRIGVVLHFARLMIWLTRRILWCLMMVGQVCSCYLLRQMEYDADLHEIRFSGSDDFVKTFMQLRRLVIAYQQSCEDQQGFFRNGKLVNDLPKLVKLNCDDQDAEMVKDIFAGVMEEKTEWLTTHPVDKDRFVRADATNEPGVFQLELPACRLFEHYTETCELVTYDAFKEVFGDELKPSMLVPVEHLVSHKIASVESSRAMRRMFGNDFSVPRAMNFQPSIGSELTAESLQSQMLGARDRMINTLSDYARMSKDYDALDSKWLLSHQARFLIDLRMKLKQENFDFSVQSASVVSAAGEQLLAEMAVLNGELRAHEQAFGQRVDAASQLLKRGISNLSAEEQNELYDQFQSVCQTLPELDKSHTETMQLRNEFSSVAWALQAVGGQDVSADVGAKIMRKIEVLATGMRTMSDRFQSMYFPFEHADGRITLSQYLLPVLPAKEDVDEVMGGAEKFLENYHFVYFRSMGTLALLCQRVESALGLEPQADPVLGDE